MKVDVYSKSGEKTGREIELPADLFDVVPNEHAVYLTVKQYLANQRQGTHKAKERSENAHSTRKLKKQKGTGGARAGDAKSGVFRGGGRIFGPQPRDYNFKLNKKVKLLARASALSVKASEGNIYVVEDFALETPRTKEFISFLSGLNLTTSKPLVITGELDRNLYLSSRNLQKSKVVALDSLNTYDIINARSLVLMEGTIKKIAEAGN